MQSIAQLFAGSLLMIVSYHASAATSCAPLTPPPSDTALLTAVGLYAPSPRPMLYTVSKAGKQHYLFGTIHLGPPLISRAPPQVVLAVRRSKVLMIEALSTPQSLSQWQKLSVNQDHASLQKALPKPLFQRYMALIERSGSPLASAARLRPWAAMLAIGSPPNRGMGIDQQILAQARSAGVRVVGMQSLADIATALNSLPPQDQLALLTDTLCQADALPAYLSQMARLYRLGNPELMHAFSHWGRDDDEVFDRFDSAMVYERNQIFLQSIDRELEGNKVFISVGAEHLIGPQGLIQALRRRGFVVSATS